MVFGVSYIQGYVLRMDVMIVVLKSKYKAFIFCITVFYHISENIILFKKKTIIRGSDESKINEL